MDVQESYCGQFKLPSQNFPGETEEYHENLSLDGQYPD